MQIDYISDLHLNHYVSFDKNPQKQRRQVQSFIERKFISCNRGDVIVLAGDYSEYNFQTICMIEHFALFYKNVVVVFGNHDHYLISQSQKKKYQECSENRLNEIQNYFLLRDDIHILQNQIKTIDNVTFAGTRLWYQLTSENSLTYYKKYNNDSQFIFSNLKGFEKVWEEYHREDFDFYNSLSSVDVMITHLPPVQPPFSPFPFNECYVSSVNRFKALKWICGHQHLVGTFERENTTFYMNAIGYPKENQEQGIQTFFIGSSEKQ